MKYFFLLFSLFFIGCTADEAIETNKTQLSPNTDSIIVSKEKEQKIELSKLYKPYNPDADAAQDLAALKEKAKKENKNILIQAGGNWCIWCLRFEKFKNEHQQIKSLIENNYLSYHLNYSEENKNEAVLKSLGDPGRLGYPVFVILNKDGQVLHTQGSESLEDGKDSYLEANVLQFLNTWKAKS